MKNIVIIGMPGAGKSTIGVILAKTLAMKFLDTDLVVQERTGRLLQDILDSEGSEAFLKAEEDAVLSLRCRDTVIATGGSVVYSRKAMDHLGDGGMIVYLRISCDEMERRIRNITTRGIVLLRGRSLAEMYCERVPLYEKFADITIGCPDCSFEECVGEVLDAIRVSAE
jgi:shikimate kinase